jgi:hypothetical protein
MSARRMTPLGALAQCLAAALGAGLAASVILGLFNAQDDGIAALVSIGASMMMVAFVVALAHVLLLGLPYALLLRRLRRDTLPMMVVGGAVIGVLPMALLWGDPFIVAVCAASGAVGAAAFHLAARPRGRSGAST